MKTAKQLSLIISVVALTFVSPGCASLMEPQAPPPPRYSPTFDYQPTESVQARSAGITIALLNPSFVSDKRNRLASIDPYKPFIANMGNDFEELLTSKGFSIKGPFGTRDEMVYGDKRDSDLALEVGISLETDYANLITHKYGYDGQYTSATYKFSGSIRYSGTLVLTVINPMNGEKFWKKSVGLEARDIHINGANKFSSSSPPLSKFLTDNGIYNPIAQGLEEYYQDALNSASKYIHVEEFKHISKEIAEANGK